MRIHRRSFIAGSSFVIGAGAAIVALPGEAAATATRLTGAGGVFSPAEIEAVGRSLALSSIIAELLVEPDSGMPEGLRADFTAALLVQRERREDALDDEMARARFLALVGVTVLGAAALRLAGLAREAVPCEEARDLDAAGDAAYEGKFACGFRADCGGESPAVDCAREVVGAAADAVFDMRIRLFTRRPPEMLVRSTSQNFAFSAIAFLGWPEGGADPRPWVWSVVAAALRQASSLRASGGENVGDSWTGAQIGT